MDGRRGEADEGATAVSRRRFSADEYHRMGETGILLEDDRIELIDGELLEMASVGDRHIGTVMALTHLLVRATGEQASISVQNPVRLDEYNEPEPDIAVVRRRPGGYRSGGPPNAGDVLLLIEVSDTTLRYDRTVKLPLYARAGIIEVWIVDLAGRTVDVCCVPGVEGYTSVARVGEDDAIAPVALPGVRVAVRDILGA